MSPKSEYRGVIIANNLREARQGLVRLGGIVGAAILANEGDWLIITRNNYRQAARGWRVPNRILVFDLSPQALPSDLWDCVSPCINRADGEPLDITYISRERRR